MNRLSFFRWRPTTTVILLCGFFLILIALVVSFIASNFKPTTEVRIGSGMYNVTVVKTKAELAKGLSGVESLPINGGMLFDFQSDDTWGIWMKDMLIPIDVIWLDSTKQVVYIKQELSPELGETQTFSPKKSSRYVLELPAGSVKKAGIKVGMKAQFTLEEPQ